MSRKLTAIAMLTALIGSGAPALAASNLPGAASIRPPVMVRPPIQPRVHIPSISRHVATQLQNQQTDPGHTAPAGGLTTSDQGTNAAMLLPAIQAAREPSRRSSANAGKGKGKIKYYQYELKNVYVSSY